MLEILGMIGKGLMALLRIAEAIDFLGHVCMGGYWLVSPSFRDRVKDYPELDRCAVYLGVFVTLIGVFVLVGATAMALIA